MMYVVSGVALVLLVGACVAVEGLPIKPAHLTTRSERDTLIGAEVFYNGQGSTVSFDHSVSGPGYCEIFTVHTPGYHTAHLNIYLRDIKVEVGGQQKTQNCLYELEKYAMVS